MSLEAEKDEAFDIKSSLIYINSTAALLETVFRNMKDEDFVYPVKKESSPDEGTIIRSEELLKRQQDEAKQNCMLTRDIYLETMLAKMSDADFTYETQKPKDPNYGRVVRAVELMGIKEIPVVTKPTVNANAVYKKDSEKAQKENVLTVDCESEPLKGDFNAAAKSYEPYNQPSRGRGNKNFNGANKQHNGKGRNWNNNRDDSGSDRGSRGRQEYSDNWQARRSNGNYNQSTSYDRHVTNDSGPHSFENRTFSPRNANYADYGNNAAPYQQRSYNTAPNDTGFYGKGQSRGRGNRNGNGNGNGGFNGNRGGRRRSNYDEDVMEW